jgi:lipoprotein-anchoring transpeptidase ErfK/SrfK
MRRKAFWVAIASAAAFSLTSVNAALAERGKSSVLQNGSDFGRNEKNFVRDSSLKRQTVTLETAEPPGTIIIETRKRRLYYVLGGGKALRYGVGVGKAGFTWSGTERISRKAQWPAWRAPKEMLERRPDIPEFVEGGPKSPLGARALYLGGTEYRIHGTPAPWTVGFADSSGCIRMTNEDVTDLYNRVKIGTKVIVR